MTGAGKDILIGIDAGTSAAYDFVERVIQGKLALQWVPVRLITDDPAKGLGRAGGWHLAGGSERSASHRWMDLA